MSTQGSSSPSGSPQTAGPELTVSTEQRRRVSALSIQSLRVELHRRQLSTAGLRAALETRLVHHLAAQAVNGGGAVSGGIRRRVRFNSHISVPERFETNPGSREEKNEQRCDAEPKRKGVAVEGVLRGRSVWITGEEEMKKFWDVMGPCGKANLSRSAPMFHTINSLSGSALKGRAMRQLLTMEEQERKEGRQGVEHLQLTLVEAYYAAFVKRRLVIKDGFARALTDAHGVWKEFCKVEHFAGMFVAFCRYRAAGWLPRSGIKYGVDWVLYPTGKKRHTHAPYCVALQWTDGLDKRWIRLQNRLRLVKNVAKTLILVRVKGGGNSMKDAFRNVTITEVTVDRWLP